MKVLVVSVNRSRQPAAVVPYGACVAAQAALGAGHETRLLDLMFEREPVKALERACRAFRPEVAGFSLRNIDNNDIRNPVSYPDEAASLIAAARRACGAKIVLGGAAAAVMPEALLRLTGADWCLLGDAASAFPRFLAALAAGGDPLSVPGACALADGGFSAEPPDLSASAGTGLFPEFGRWVDLRAYARHMAAVPLKTKLGCPFGCVYCTYPAGEGGAYRLCLPETVLQAVRDLAAAGVRDIEFVDNVFNSPYAHAMELCGLLAGNRTGARFHTMELNPGFTDAPLLDAMERAGFAGIGVTAESADGGVLAALGKNYGPAELYQAARAVEEHSIPCMWMFLLGGPGETKETVERTLAFARRRVRPSDTVFFNAGIRLYPGTPLEAAARREGSLTEPPGGMLEPVFYLSPGVEKSWLLETLAAATGENMNFIASDSFALPYLSGIYGLAHFAGVEQPLWKHTRFIRRGLKSLGVKL
ncbi:MAG: radical SAM protein [Elusimicrobia bacterium]|nr:radical SAM protein [Elusimicrobiota bacterium]